MKLIELLFTTMITIIGNLSKINEYETKWREIKSEQMMMTLYESYFILIFSHLILP